MRTVGAFEAKTHFSQLLSSVAEGNSVAISKHGNTVAFLIPAPQHESKESVITMTINAIKKRRKGIRLGKDLSIKELKELGRK